MFIVLDDLKFKNVTAFNKDDKMRIIKTYMIDNDGFLFFFEIQLILLKYLI